MGPYVASVPSGSLNQASTVTFKLGPGTEDVASVKSREGRKTRSAAVAMAEEIILGLAGGGGERVCCRQNCIVQGKGRFNCF